MGDYYDTLRVQQGVDGMFAVALDDARKLRAINEELLAALKLLVSQTAPPEGHPARNAIAMAEPTDNRSPAELAMDVARSQKIVDRPTERPKA